MPTAGLLYGAEPHFLDHLAPLCALAHLPLVVTEEEIAGQAKKFYPDLELLYWEPNQAPERFVQNFDTAIVCTPRLLFEQVFFFAQHLQNKRIKTIWCPHGNSDKGRHSPFMEALKEEEVLLTYGKRIENFLKIKGVEGKTFRVGNYRLAYFEKHRNFYLQFFPKKTKPALLYAPTWQDGENNSSFPRIWPYLKETPSDFTLFVKLHPHLYLQFPDAIEHMKKELPEHVLLIEEFPPVYPLLSQLDLYIGDLSSIGYDFLPFKKPMLFLKPSELSKGQECFEEGNGKELFEKCRRLIGKKTGAHPLLEETFSRFSALQSLRQ
jgi:teichoic acid glycerol-phosphate primase